ncbi:MAG: hypothetical protein OXG84_03860 [Chloroflexi bacterium]|nr:hypothetical protein [Chloroflexota bacterium]
MDLNWINMLESAIPAFALLSVCYLLRRYDSWQRVIRDMDQLSIPRDTTNSTSLERGCKMKRKRSSLNGDNTISIRLPRNDGNKRNEQLRKEMNTRFDAMEARLRGVETEQARVAGLLEGLALTGRLPDQEDALD